jgi:uncharacterized protein YdeI (YjbR/CyaY-like superfamily)
MKSQDERIDLYIAKSADFAQPILNHLRKVIHSACPGVNETIKWGFPHFDYCGEILCSFASFKQHCSFGFWKASIMNDPYGLLQTVGKTAMGHMGKLTNLSDLPTDKILKEYIKEAARLNKEGIKLPTKVKTASAKSLEVPPYFTAALKKNKKALQTFEAFSYSHKKEYVEWVIEAKTDATRDKRMATTIEWLSEGKNRHWKHVKS